MGRARNFAGVKHQILRERIDPIINALHDELEIAYYQHWRQGTSMPWMGIDVAATPAQSKQRFDALHGLLFHIHVLAFHKLNKASENYPEDEYDAAEDETGPISKVSQSRAWIAAARAQRPAATNALLARIKADIFSRLGHDLNLEAE